MLDGGPPPTADHVSDVIDRGWSWWPWGVLRSVELTVTTWARPGESIGWRPRRVVEYQRTYDGRRWM